MISKVVYISRSSTFCVFPSLWRTSGIGTLFGIRRWSGVALVALMGLAFGRERAISASCDEWTCVPNSVTAEEGAATVHLQIGNEDGVETNFEWGRFSTNGIWAPLTNNAKKYAGLDKKKMTIKDFVIASDVGLYGRRNTQRPIGEPLACNDLVYVLGIDRSKINITGTFTVFGAVMNASATFTNSFCNGLPCPGNYGSYVTYSAGWKALGVTKASAILPPIDSRTSVRYYCAPPVTSPTCGCGGMVEIVQPEKGKVFTFTAYIPQGVQVPSVVGITLSGFE